MSVSDSKWHFNFAKGIDEKWPQKREKERRKPLEHSAHRNPAIRLAGYAIFHTRWTEQLMLYYNHSGFVFTIISIRKFLQPLRENILGFLQHHFKWWVYSKDRKKDTFLFISHLLLSKFLYIYHVPFCDTHIHSIHRVGKRRVADPVRAQPMCPPIHYSGARGRLLMTNTIHLEDFWGCRNVLSLPRGESLMNHTQGFWVHGPACSFLTPQGGSLWGVFC